MSKRAGETAPKSNVETQDVGDITIRRGLADDDLENEKGGEGKADPAGAGGANPDVDATDDDTTEEGAEDDTADDVDETAGGEADGADGADDSAEKEPAYVQELRERNDRLDRTLEQLRKKVGGDEEEGDEDKEVAYVEPNMPAERWAQLEDLWGFKREKDNEGNEVMNVNPRKLMNAVARGFHQQKQDLMKEFKAKLYGEIAVFKQEAAFTDLARDKNFADVRTYRTEIKDWLERHYPDKRRHSDKKLLIDALLYARGKNQGKKLKKIQSDNVRKTTILRPGGAKSGGGPQHKAVHPEEVELARQAGIPLAEWRKWK